MNAIVVGCVLGALGVVAGAFGAHALKSTLDADALATWHTAVLYQLVHAVALVLHGLFTRDRSTRGIAAWCFAVGVALFSGSLYALALGAPRWCGAITPFGGTLFIAGWIAFALEARRR